ncbi:MAG: mechanosensitive ion channel family protein, partial [Pseudomonadota bacterium]
LVLLREPFRIGDHIECDGVEGKVETITIRDSHIRQTDGQLVVVPNAQLFQNPVTVRTDQDIRRTSIICGIAYGEDVDAARDVIAEAVRKVDLVRDDVRDIQVFAHAFGASSIDFEITWWTGSQPLDIRSSRDRVVAAVKAALDQAGIEIPFPYRTLTVNGPIPVQSVGEQDRFRDQAEAS